MTGIVHAMADRSDDAAVEALTRVLAIQTGLIRAGTEQQMDEAIGRLPAEARHGFRELALQYVTVVRDADIEEAALAGTLEGVNREFHKVYPPAPTPLCTDCDQWGPCEQHGRELARILTPPMIEVVSK